MWRRSPEVVRFRPGHTGDAFALVRLMRDAIEAHAGPAYGEEELAEWRARITEERLRGFLADPEEQFVVAELEGRPVGLASRRGRLVRLLYVAPDQMGRRLGRLLMERLEAAARAEGLPYVELDASRNAVPVYARLGYTRVSVVGCGGDALLGTRMMKRL